MAACATFAQIPALPEPSLVFYGRITQSENGQAIHPESVVWTVSGNSESVTVSQSQTIVQSGEVFYISRIPLETRQTADGIPLASTAGSLEATASPVTYTRTVTVNGKAASLPQGSSSFSHGAATLGRMERLDLIVAGSLTLPSVIDPTALNITPQGALLGGKITHDGGAPISERGVVYSLTKVNHAPAADSPGVIQVAVPGGTGVFAVPVTGLEAGITYSYRAYASNSEGTSYSVAGTFTTLPTPPGFAYIPSGSFTMGAISSDGDADATAHEVSLTACVLQQKETTKAEWDEVRSWAVLQGYTDLPQGSGKSGSHPVTGVSWWDVVKWCNARSEKEGLTPCYTNGPTVMRTGTTAPSVNWNANGYRLPTEAEWEKGARGGITAQRFPWGTKTIRNGAAEEGGQANYQGATSGFAYDLGPDGYNPAFDDGLPPYTSPAGSFPANGHGLYDMAGNVSEWCWDWYAAEAYTPGRQNPRGPDQGTARVLRGGSWNSHADNARCSARSGHLPEIKSNEIGFRLAQAAVPAVSLPTVADVTATSAVLGADVTNDGGSLILERGVVYSLTNNSSDPVLGGSGVTKVVGTGSTGVFSVQVTGLASGSSYHFKAFASNSLGTTYTSTGTFSTLSTNAFLSSLALSNGSLVPVFSRETTTYAFNVAHATNVLKVTPTPEQAEASIRLRVNGGSYSNLTGGEESPPLGLNVGTNLVEIQVTAQDGITTRTYTLSVTREKEAQTILFATIPDQLTTDTVPLTATGGGSGIPVKFTVTAGPGVITGNSLSFTTSGTVTITASQTGNDEYLEAESVARTFNVNKAVSLIHLNQLIHIADGTPRAVSGTTSPPDLALTVTYAGSSMAPSLPGTYLVQATIDDPVYQGTATATMKVLGITGMNHPIQNGSAAPSATNGSDFEEVRLGEVQPRIFTIHNTDAQALSVEEPIIEIQGAHASDFRVIQPSQSLFSASGTTSLEVRFAPTQPGIRQATLRIASSEIANGPITFAIGGFGTLPLRRSQTITFTPTSVVYLNQSPLQLSATASSGLPTTLHLISGQATLSVSGELAFTSTGTIKVEARQAGDGNHAPAPTVARVIAIKAAPAAMTLVDLVKTYNGLPQGVGITGGSEEPVQLTYRVNGTYRTEPPTQAGRYEVRAVAGMVTKTGTLVIQPATLVVQAESKRRLAGEANPPLTVFYEGFQGSDSPANSITKPVSITTTATVSSPVGSYAITSSGGATNGNYRLLHRPGTMVVEGMSGSYEALLRHPESGLPNGHLLLTVPATSRTFTANLRLGSETSMIPWSGSLFLSSQNRLATGTANKTLSGVNYELRVTLSLFGELTTCEVRRAGLVVANAEDGIRLLNMPSGKKAPQEGAYTAILEPATPNGSGMPAGAGWATVKVDAKGKMTLAGRLADGTAFTSALSVDMAVTPGYRLFMQPYAPARKDSHLGGSFTLLSHPRLTSRSYVAGSTLTWVKAAQPKDLGYRTGFGPVTTVLRLDPWQSPTTAIQLAARLELGTEGRWEVEHSSTGSPSESGLPTMLSVTPTNLVNVASPQANTRKWKMTITPTTGAWTGSFELLDATEVRKVNFSGVLRQTPTTVDELIGGGHYLLPSLKNASSNEVRSGAVLFWRLD